MQLSAQCYALPRSKDYPELQAFEGPKTKRKKQQQKKQQLAPKPGHLLEVIHYKNKKLKINQTPQTSQVSVYEGTWNSSSSLYKTTYSSFKIFQWPADSEPPAAARRYPGCSHRGQVGRVGSQPAPPYLFTPSINAARGGRDGWRSRRSCCAQWGQGRLGSKGTELLESGIVCSSSNVEVLRGMRVDSRSPKCRQGSLPF